MQNDTPAQNQQGAMGDRFGAPGQAGNPMQGGMGGQFGGANGTRMQGSMDMGPMGGMQNQMGAPGMMGGMNNGGMNNGGRPPMGMSQQMMR